MRLSYLGHFTRLVTWDDRIPPQTWLIVTPSRSGRRVRILMSDATIKTLAAELQRCIRLRQRLKRRFPKVPPCPNLDSNAPMLPTRGKSPVELPKVPNGK